MAKVMFGVDFDEFEESTGGFGSAVCLPPAVYTSDEFFPFEMNAVFEREWVCVGRVDQVAEPGDFFTVTVLGEPLIVARNFEGEVHVMSSVCQHRAMCITAPAERPPAEWLELPPETKGNTRTFQCPYHWWIYDINGRLLGAPEMHKTPGFERSQVSLPKVRTEVWMGFIFINLGGEAEPLAPRLKGLEDFLANWHVEEMVTVEPHTIPGLPFNWKVMVENFMEAYHPDRLHQHIHDFAPSSLIDYAPYEPGMCYMYGRGGTTNRDGGFNPTTQGLFPPIETLSDAERESVNFAFVPPGLLMGFQSDSAFWFTVLPTGAGTHDLSMAYIFPKATTESPLFERTLEMAVKGVEYFNNQDLPANTAVQRGLTSRFAPRGRYSWQEGVLASFNTWLVEHYQAAAGQPVSVRSAQQD